MTPTRQTLPYHNRQSLLLALLLLWTVVYYVIHNKRGDTTRTAALNTAEDSSCPEEVTTTTTNSTGSPSSSLTAVNTPSSAPTKKSSCHFHNAVGSFRFSEDNKFSWNNWQSYLCPTVDFLDKISSKTNSSSSGPLTKEPLTLLFLGDSLDHNLMLHVCDLPGFVRVDVRANENKAPMAKDTLSICSSERASITIAFFQIFGMAYPCTNSKMLGIMESREHNSTVFRIQELLSQDLISHLNTTIEQTFIMAASCMWDLSDGCNNVAYLKEEYKKSYASGVQSLRQELSTKYTRRLFFHTCAPVSQSYSTTIQQQFEGRTRQNQQHLNQILRDTLLSSGGDDRIVDWWKMLIDIPETIRERDLQVDGRHYSKEPSLAFFNLWLNTIFDQEPDLLL